MSDIQEKLDKLGAWDSVDIFQETNEHDVPTGYWIGSYTDWNAPNEEITLDQMQTVMQADSFDHALFEALAASGLGLIPSLMASLS